MPPKWTGNVVKKMFLNNITRKDVANELGITVQCLSYWLRGERTPKYAEEKVNDAIDFILAKRKS